jgi:pimeloyl-ACP methyl ester carboxylesterase
MMPFSVLRTLFGGLLSWIVLGAAIYCLYEWADGVDPMPPAREVRDPQTGRVTVLREPVRNLDRQGGWPYLAAGLGLTALTFGGFLPISLFLSRPGGMAAVPEENRRSQIVDRPDGSRLFVEFFGPENGPTIVFTHGWSLEGRVFSELIARLSDRFRLVIWDLPGLGRSQGPANRDFSLEKMANDLAAVVEAAGKGSVILVGHSIGGMISQTYCRLYANHLGSRVAGIALLHTTYTNPLNTAFGRSVWKAIEKPILVPLNHLTVWLAPLAWLSSMQSYLNGNLHIVTRIASFSGQQTWGQLNYSAWLAAKSWPGVVARGNLAMLDFDEQEALPRVEVPALVIAAHHDRMTCPDASDRLATLLPNSLESGIRGGHLGFLERPSEVAELIAEFAEKHATSLSETKPAASAAFP